jgi:hypothetical protein
MRNGQGMAPGLVRPFPVLKSDLETRYAGKPRLKPGSSDADSGVNRTPFRRGNIGTLAKKRTDRELASGKESLPTYKCSLHTDILFALP